MKATLRFRALLVVGLTLLATATYLLFPSRVVQSPYENERDLEVPEGRMPVALSFEPGGRFLLAVNINPGPLLIYDLDAPGSPKQLDHHEFRNGLLMSPDGTSFAAGCEDPAVRILKWDSGEVLQTLSELKHWGFKFSWSPDGRLLACANVEESIGIWDPRNGKKLHTLAGHENGVEDIAFSPDGRRLASASLDGTFRIWSTADWKEERILHRPRDPGWALSVAFSPDGTLLAGGGGFVTSAEDTSPFHGFIRIWRTSDWKEVHALNFSGPARSLAFRPDGALLLFGLANTIQLYDVKKQRPAGWHRAPSEASAWFSPDGKRIASAGLDHRIRIWKLRP